MEQFVIRQHIAKRLIELRQGNNQADIANALKIKRSTYQAYEEERAVPPLSVLMDLRDLYGFRSIDDLITPGAPAILQDPLSKAYKTASRRVQEAVNALLHLPE